MSNTAACYSSLGTINVVSLIGSYRDLGITNEQTGLFLSILVHFKLATAL